MACWKRAGLFLLFGLFIGECYAYNITGKLNMQADWQHQIYLATINKLDNYHSSNAELIINAAPIDQQGNFEISGDNLPDEFLFYKLYLIKEEFSEFNACLFLGGEEHNFQHLLLNNNSAVHIEADEKAYAPFGDCEISGDRENKLMQELSEIIYPNHIFYEVKFPSELQFSHDKMNRELFNFADTCGQSLVSLAALYNSDMDAYFDTEFERYKKVNSRLLKDYPKHNYTEDYHRKLRYYGYEQGKENPFWKYFSLLLAGLLVWVSFKWYSLYREFKTQSAKPQIVTPNLTNQEYKILELIKQGKSNKEIASTLFVELSTVKSHINKIYTKLEVKNRSEAKQIAENMIK